MCRSNRRERCSSMSSKDCRLILAFNGSLDSSSCFRHSSAVFPGTSGTDSTSWVAFWTEEIGGCSALLGEDESTESSPTGTCGGGLAGMGFGVTGASCGTGSGCKNGWAKRNSVALLTLLWVRMRAFVAARRGKPISVKILIRASENAVHLPWWWRSLCRLCLLKDRTWFPRFPHLQFRARFEQHTD